MKNRSFTRIKKNAALLGSSLLLAAVLTGCGTKNEAAGLHQTGTVAFMLNCDQAASVYFEKAIDANPEYGPSYIMLGDCYLREGKAAKAVEVIKKGLNLELEQGHQRLAHRKLARAYKQLGEPEKALEHITIYTRMSVYQEKLTAQKKSETETFLAELELPQGHKTVSVEKIVEDTEKARESSNAAKQEDTDIIEIISFGLI
ncbi:tetratricopeptide repeat protein [Maridesulfovibrio hydrothermalis]|uniref:TPR repeat-containing protein n=1 Tax=Maridesulfovibrio hydrothermalis AM13 = DSM 14728 TaxID=1121451 RepID=L0RGS2_9BACT|nr:tetratricopeptide repeat protein [Maridesulfovibrio hydrothermalis]CCO24791.1 TPR repeat-containing protein [Maridesulfovibrio hydrothermalis AM13 = DSM 14728]